MSDRQSRHTTLLAGLRIASHRAFTNTDKLSFVDIGTLTGLATRRRDNKKVLVTNLHIMAGRADDLGYRTPHLRGDWDIRFRPDDSGEPWSVDSADQWGEPYLILTQEGDIILDD